jgi:hypothetical protein
MGTLMIGNFGVENGVQTFRINGTKEDLYKIIDECREMDAHFQDTPNLLPLRQGQWTMLLKIRLPVGAIKND